MFVTSNIKTYKQELKERRMKLLTTGSPHRSRSKDKKKKKKVRRSGKFRKQA